MGTPKTRRVSSAQRQHVIETFRDKVSSGTKLRLYTFPDSPRKLIVHSISDYGGQQLFRALQKRGSIEFEPVGYANPGFTHREVFGSDVQRKGLARKMLRVHEAIERKAGAEASIIHADKKSVLLFLLNHGYHLDAKSRLRLAKEGVHTQKELFLFASRAGTRDVLPFGVHLVRPLRKK